MCGLSGGEGGQLAAHGNAVVGVQCTEFAAHGLVYVITPEALSAVCVSCPVVRLVSSCTC
jgi:hypothetical protein